MSSEEVKVIVARLLDEYRYEPPASGSTTAAPWPAEKVYRYRDQLRTHLVEPALKHVELRDTYAQAMASAPAFADVWVVAEVGKYLVFFDSTDGLFGLAERSYETQQHVTIGVRGGLVDVYCSV
jgi:hypothetical protein